MNSFTTSDGVQYEIDELGIIHQLNPQPFAYDANYVATYDTDAYRRDNDRLQAMRYAFAVACHGHTPGKIFDYGCGNLAFVNYARQSSWAVGYDITGLPGTVTELQAASVYTFWDALEHVPDLDAVLSAIDCETICISLPWCHYHRDGLQWFDTWKHRKPNEHLHHFDADSLTQLLAKHGFTNRRALSFHEDIVRKGDGRLPNILSMGFRRS
jgi:hypothetical protein